MTKIKLRYTGSHQPKKVLEVTEDKVEGLLETGNYVVVGEKPKEIKKEEKKEEKTEVKEDGELRRRS